MALEVKASRQAGSEDGRGLRAFRSGLPEKVRGQLRGVVLHTGEENRPLGEGFHALSLHPLAPGQG